jgi:hypothetical protein
MGIRPSGTTALQLTDEQAETARALGCRFIAATEAQVRQFSMQRRVFTIGGEPFLAARQDGFYETAGTLLALIAGATGEREAAPSSAPEPSLPASPPPTDDEAVPEQPEKPAEEATEPSATVPAIPVSVSMPVLALGHPRPTAQVMAATVTIVKGYARRGILDTASLTSLVAAVHRTLQRLR